jgi:5'-3' exonuclease
MIIVDYNHTVIANVMAELRGRTDIPIEIDLLRHMVLNSLRGYKQKFSAEYGELVIACDNKNNWRKKVFEYYKASRKKNRDDSSIDWASLYECMDILRTELDQFFPYAVLKVEHCEADDIVGTLAKWSQTNDLQETMFDEDSPKPFLIMSRDSDFIQLQKYPNVKQYSPVDKKWIKPNRSPELDLYEKIICGDPGDGIPNFLSDDDTFVTEGKRQKSVYQAKLEVWLTHQSKYFCTTDQLKKNFERNQKLISFDYIPEDIQEDIINTFVSQPKKDRSQLLNYFIKNKLKNLVNEITTF